MLFSSVRGQYSDESKPDVECIFCAIRDNDPDVWTREIYRDEEALVIMNIYPYSPGHIQVIPTRHVENPKELTQKEAKHLLGLVQKGITLTEKTMDPSGWNIGLNLGEAGASIKHLHLQIVPRYDRTVENSQEKIHDRYLENLRFLKEDKSSGPEEEGECNCFADRRYILKKEPYVYLSQAPYNRGHLIVSPDRHVEDPRELSKEEFQELFGNVAETIEIIKKVYHPVGFNMGINLGMVKNTSEHLQIHVAPRYDPESGFMEVIGNSRVVVESLDQTYEKLKDEFD